MMLNKLAQSACLLAAMLAFTGCATTSSMSNDDARAAVEAANAIFVEVFGQGDGAAVAALYTDNAIVLPSGSAPITGTENIAAFWQGAMDSGIKGGALKTVEAEAFRDTINELGEYELFDGEGNRLDQGNYVVIWKNRDGSWKLHWDMFSTSAASE